MYSGHVFAQISHRKGVNTGRAVEIVPPTVFSLAAQNSSAQRFVFGIRVGKAPTTAAILISLASSSQAEH